MDVVNEYTSLDANGVYLKAAEVLNRKCPLLALLPLVASNQIMSNIGSRDSYLPSPGVRRFNEPISPTASHSTPFSETIAMFEDYSEVDEALYKIQNSPDQWRFNQDRRKIEGLTQKLEYELFYGNLGDNPGSINGLATRFAVSTHRPNDDSSWPYNVKLAGGSGSDTTSIWIVEFGPEKVFGIFPKNLPAGLQIENLGKSTKESTSGLFEVLRTHLTWFIGIEIDDERCVQRIANVESAGSSNIFDEEDLIAVKNQLPSMGEAPGTAILVDRTIKTQMDKRAVSQRMNTYFTQDAAGDVWGRPVTRFQGIPVLVAEKILDTETAIS
jgi:hypothetical protein